MQQRHLWQRGHCRTSATDGEEVYVAAAAPLHPQMMLDHVPLPERFNLLTLMHSVREEVLVSKPSPYEVRTHALVHTQRLSILHHAAMHDRQRKESQSAGHQRESLIDWPTRLTQDSSKCPPLWRQPPSPAEGANLNRIKPKAPTHS